MVDNGALYKNGEVTGDTWLAQFIEHAALGPRVVSSSPTLDIELIVKK